MSQVLCVKIHLAEPARTKAASASFPVPPFMPSTSGSYEVNHLETQAYYERYLDELQAQREFTGPDFQDIARCAVSEGTVDVHLHDGTIYMYPLHTVVRIKAYTK